MTLRLQNEIKIMKFHIKIECIFSALQNSRRAHHETRVMLGRRKASYLRDEIVRCWHQKLA
jgi:hypothetical protein